MMIKLINRKSVLLFLLGSLLIFSLFTAGCTVNNGTNTPSSEVASGEPASIEDVLPSATNTIEPTPVPTATEAPTAVPTETPVPELGLVEDGVAFWTIPMDSGMITISTKGKSEDYLNSHIGFMENDLMNLQVPANYIIAEVQFNQPMPTGVKFQVLEMDAVTPWFEAPFSMDANNANQGELLVDHRYLINPPFWEITYHARIADSTGKIYWENDLRIFKALPNTCWDGSLPDPVTLYCKSYDGDWNYRDFPGFNPYADMFTSGQWELDDEYYYVTPEG